MMQDNLVSGKEWTRAFVARSLGKPLSQVPDEESERLDRMMEDMEGDLESVARLRMTELFDELQRLEDLERLMKLLGSVLFEMGSNRTELNTEAHHYLWGVIMNFSKQMHLQRAATRSLDEKQRCFALRQLSQSGDARVVPLVAAIADDPTTPQKVKEVARQVQEELTRMGEEAVPQTPTTEDEEAPRHAGDLPSSAVYEKNLARARQINQEARTNPASPYVSKWVGIVDGQVAAIADTLDELSDMLDKVGAYGERCMVVEASADYDTAYEI